MRLLHVPPTHIDVAWKQGADALGAACERSGGEVTGCQLKLLLARGELTLLAIVDGAPDAPPLGWLAVAPQQTPNLRVLHVQAIHAPGATAQAAFDQLRGYARALGCSVIRGACGPAVARLWTRRFAARPVYTVMEMQA